MKYRAAVTDYTFTDLDIERRILASADCDLIEGQCKTEGELIQLCGRQRSHHPVRAFECQCHQGDGMRPRDRALRHRGG